MCHKDFNLAPKEVWPLPSALGSDFKALGMSWLIEVFVLLGVLGHSK